MSSRRNVVSFYTAPARSGKTFRMVVRIVDEILPRTEGMIYTNLPLYVDEIAEYCADRHRMNPDEVKERLHLIPRETEESWRDAGRPVYDDKGKRTGMSPLDGPWEYFADRPLSGATIIIDEIHNFCGSIGTPKPVSNKWQKWLGELGHNQAIFICISQAPEKVHASIKQEVQASYTIRNTGLDRDPYFHIEFYDWFELWSGLFGGEYRIFVFEQETQKIEGKKVRGERVLYRMGQPYFDLYDSFNKPIDSGQAADVSAFEHEYEKHLKKGRIRGRLSLIRWFLVKNAQGFFRAFSKMAFVVAVLVFLRYGGAAHITNYITSGISGKQPAAIAADERGEVLPELPDNLQKPAGTVTDAERDRLEQIRKTYEEELRKSLIERDKLTAELEKAKKEIGDLMAVAMMTPTTVIFKRGHEYAIGQKILSGDYKGRTITGINYRRREAVLDDGSVLHLADE